jgi:hypothetical protein
MIFRVTPPDGGPFYARIIDVDGLAAVVSNRGGRWAPETLLTVADLVMPEQEFAEWDVRQDRPTRGAVLISVAEGLPAQPGWRYSGNFNSSDKCREKLDENSGYRIVE